MPAAAAVTGRNVHAVGIGRKLVKGNETNTTGLLSIPGPTPLGAKCEFVEVVFQVLMADRSLWVPRIQRFSRGAIRCTRGSRSDADQNAPAPAVLLSSTALVEPNPVPNGPFVGVAPRG